LACPPQKCPHRSMNLEAGHGGRLKLHNFRRTLPRALSDSKRELQPAVADLALVAIAAATGRAEAPAILRTLVLAAIAAATGLSVTVVPIRLSRNASAISSLEIAIIAPQPLRSCGVAERWVISSPVALDERCVGARDRHEFGGDREFTRYGIGTQLVVQKITCLLRLTWVAS
jgi:hypothetical protein